MRKLFDTVLTFLRQWESDKWIHVVAFLLLAWAVGRCVGFFGVPDMLSKVIGAVVSAALGVAKECFDKRTENLFDRQDLWASWSGVAIYILVSV